MSGLKIVLPQFPRILLPQVISLISMAYTDYQLLFLFLFCFSPSEDAPLGSDQIVWAPLSPGFLGLRFLSSILLQPLHSPALRRLGLYVFVSLWCDSLVRINPSWSRRHFFSSWICGNQVLGWKLSQPSALTGGTRCCFHYYRLSQVISAGKKGSSGWKDGLEGKALAEKHT